jgi:hypothetical protein
MRPATREQRYAKSERREGAALEEFGISYQQL